MARVGLLLEISCAPSARRGPSCAAAEVRSQGQKEKEPGLAGSLSDHVWTQHDD